MSTILTAAFQTIQRDSAICFPMLGSAPIHADDRLARVRDADAQDFFECKALIFQRIGKRIFLQFFEPEFSADDFRRFIPALCGDFGRMFPRDRF